jgi:hypothetical protein
LTFLGTGSAALAAGSSGALAGCAKSQEEDATIEASPKEEAQAPVGGVGKQPFFEPIEPIDADELVLPEGFKYDIVRR